MIIFESDWNKYPTAIVDYQTTNKTFLRLVDVYRQMGVKNCLFPLVLLQPELQGVDPFDEDLTEEQKIMVGLECKYNVWYYLREVARVPPNSGTKPVPFRANRGNIALIWCFFAGVDVALIQPRQTGKSVSTDILMNLLIQIIMENTMVTLITKDHDLRTQNIERLKRIRDLLPRYLNSYKKNVDSDNQLGLTCKALGNRYITGVSQSSESGANNLGRGLTTPVVHIDEAPFISHIGTTLPAALTAGSAARQEAIDNNQPYGNIFTTTAGKKDDRDGRYMHDIICGGAVWTEMFFDVINRETLEDLVAKNSKGDKVIVNATFGHRQLGYTDEWLYKTMKTVGSTGEKADRDFFNIWTAGTQSSPLSVKQNERIKQSERDVVWTSISKEGYIIRWYDTEENVKRRMQDSYFGLGLDTSEAIGRDGIGGVITDFKDMSTLGAFTCNETNLINFTHFLANILITYTNITLIIERKSTGQMIVDALIILLREAGMDPFRRIYNTLVDEQNTNKEHFKLISGDMSRRSNDTYDRYKKTFGFTTTGSSRNLLYSSVLQNAAEQSGHLVKDKTLSDEIRGLVVKKGRIDHDTSGHDDMVIAWLLTHWFIRHSKHLDFYGIEMSKILVKAEATDDSTPEERFQLELQNRIKREVGVVCDQLGSVTDPVSIMMLERRLRVLKSKLTDEEKVTLSIDSLIKDAEESRRTRRLSHGGHRSVDMNQAWRSANNGIRSSQPGQRRFQYGQRG